MIAPREADKVNRYTRAGKAGRLISCPICGAEVLVFNFAWSALTCGQCGRDVKKAAWELVTDKQGTGMAKYHQKPESLYDSLVMILELAMDAPSDAQAKRATELAQQIAAKLTDAEIQSAQAEAARDGCPQFKLPPGVTSCWIELENGTFYVDDSTGEHLAYWAPKGGKPQQCGNGAIDE
jgi:ribosomal protein L37AE/L43A